MERILKSIKRLVVFGLSAIITIYLYNEWLNTQIQVTHETIEIEELPEEFNGYTILHFADLHGVQFGKEQEKLIKLINSLDYDIVAITGDVINRHNRTLAPLFNLIDGIKDERPILFSKGNIDSDDDVMQIKNYGIEVMDKPYIVEKNGKRLVFQKYDFYQQIDLRYDNDIVIGLGHEPFPQDLGYKLILVGHYHAGQVRIPGYGAIYVPSIEGSKWVTDQSQIVGLQKFDGYYQHITGGLGASAQKQWMQKRWFNPPQINILKLIKR